MTKKNTTTRVRAPKKRAEKPVSEGIKRAAERAGIAAPTVTLERAHAQAIADRLQNAIDLVIEQSSAECDSEAIEAARDLIYARRELEKALRPTLDGGAS